MFSIDIKCAVKQKEELSASRLKMHILQEQIKENLHVIQQWSLPNIEELYIGLKGSLEEFDEEIQILGQMEKSLSYSIDRYDYREGHILNCLEEREILVHALRPGMIEFDSSRILIELLG